MGRRRLGRDGPQWAANALHVHAGRLPVLGPADPLPRGRVVLILRQTVGDLEPRRLAANKDVEPRAHAKIVVERRQRYAVFEYGRPEQMARYDALRGYSSDAAPAHDHRRHNG
jgi:hypothetical protein